MTNQRTSKRGLSLVLFMAVALPSSATLADSLNLQRTDGAGDVQRGISVSLEASVTAGSCLIRTENPCRTCSFTPGTLRAGKIGELPLVEGTVQQTTRDHTCDPFAPRATQRFPFSTSQPVGEHFFQAHIDSTGTTLASNQVKVTWIKATSSTSLIVGYKPGPLLSDTPVTLRADVTGFAPGRRVNFKNGGITIASADATNSSGAIGTTIFETTRTLGPGTYNVIAEYEGDPNNHSSSSSAAPQFTVTISPTHVHAIQIIIDALLLDD